METSDNQTMNLPVRWAFLRTPNKWVSAVLIGMLAVVILLNAWVCDDAYITLRTVDNFVHGYGLTWNTVERVQVYTHPLWMLILSVGYFFTREAFFTPILLNVALSIAAIIVSVGRLSRNLITSILLAAMLLFSKAFIDYTSSGLENALSYLLITLFLYVYFRKDSSQKRFFTLALLTGLVGLNRLDLLLVVLPPLAYAAWGLPKPKAALLLLAGFAPLLLWEIFSLFYYGFPFPNTAYAKLNTGIDLLQLARQGLKYYANSFTSDPLTLFLIAISMAAAFASRKKQNMAVAAGMALYMLYIVKVGGDFMSGRFFSCLVPCGAILLVESITIKPLTAAIMTCVVVFVALFAPFPPIVSWGDFGSNAVYAIDKDGISDERRFFYPTCGLLRAGKGRAMPAHEWAERGRNLRSQPGRVTIITSVGMLAFFAGQEHYFVDTNALGDALLARLPALGRPFIWRIGHFTRALPQGYVGAIGFGGNMFRDKDPGAYYDKLRLVTRGRLWDGQRLTEIWRFSTGQNDYLLKPYWQEPMVSATPSEINSQQSQGLAFGQAGLEIKLGGLCHGKLVQAYFFPSNEEYMGVFCKDSAPLCGFTIKETPSSMPDWVNWRIHATNEVQASGYDSIRIFPVGGKVGCRISRISIGDQPLSQPTSTAINPHRAE
jgi:arabinofuranosyltransferase